MRQQIYSGELRCGFLCTCPVGLIVLFEYVLGIFRKFRKILSHYLFKYLHSLSSPLRLKVHDVRSFHWIPCAFYVVWLYNKSPQNSVDSLWHQPLYLLVMLYSSGPFSWSCPGSLMCLSPTGSLNGLNGLTQMSSDLYWLLVSRSREPWLDSSSLLYVASYPPAA